MRRRETLRERVESQSKYIGELKDRLRNAENLLGTILKRRRFNRGQAKALTALLTVLHVPTITETMNVVLRDVYGTAIRQELNRPTQLLRLFGLKRK